MNKLYQMTQVFPMTHYWNDSCSEDELSYAIERGACGATTNPVIVKQVLDNELEKYSPFIRKLISENPRCSEDEIAWLTMEKMAADGAELLRPYFDPSTGKGRISIQTNSKYFNNSQRLAEQAIHLSNIAPNIQVKIPLTEEGLSAVKEATYAGVSINATVSFSAAQAVHAAETVEEALKAREDDGLSCESVNPIVTIMVGRLDDWLKYVVKRDSVKIDPAALDWAGIACAKKAYHIFKEKKYKSRLLIAAYRHENHWTQFMGGDLSLTIPHKNQIVFNSSSAEIKSHIDDPVPQDYIDQLMILDDFQKAFCAMEPHEFNSYGPVNKTLEQFAAGYDELVHIIRGFMIKY